METAKKSLSIPLKMGLIIGAVYCGFIFMENKVFYANPVQFGIAKVIGYLFILSGYFYTGYLSRKKAGGYITFQECLKAMLLTIAITELIYLLFSIVYIKVIDPDFIQKLKVSSLTFFERIKMPEDQINYQMKNFNEAGKITFWNQVQTYGFSIIIDAVFAMIFAAILKKSKPAVQSQY